MKQKLISQQKQGVSSPVPRRPLGSAGKTAGAWSRPIDSITRRSHEYMQLSLYYPVYLHTMMFIQWYGKHYFFQDKWTSERKQARMNEWMNERINEWVNEWMKSIIFISRNRPLITDCTPVPWVTDLKTALHPNFQTTKFPVKKAAENWISGNVSFGHSTTEL
jgi:hypothetical protein